MDLEHTEGRTACLREEDYVGGHCRCGQKEMALASSLVQGLLVDTCGVPR